MSDLDTRVLAEKVAAVERHLHRVADHLPADAGSLRPLSAGTDTVVLHLWQAIQIVLDLGTSLAVRLHLGTPSSYGDAFNRLAAAGYITVDLAGRLARAAGLHNRVDHAYEALNLDIVLRSARDGPADLRAFLAAVRDVVSAMDSS